jgi:hypothetical protein
MANLACCYHENLQNDLEPPPTDKQRKQQIRELLNAIPAAQSIKDPRRTHMNALLDKDSVQEALECTKGGTATGTDSLPYKLWKELKKEIQQ